MTSRIAMRARLCTAVHSRRMVLRLDSRSTHHVTLELLVSSKNTARTLHERAKTPLEARRGASAHERTRRRRH